ncbi:hypothetical protein ACXR2U_14175 [Jatrophihabitans sp. YIM 134969]
MVVLGLVLLLAAAVAGVVVVYENSGGDHTTTFAAFGGEWNVDVYWVAVIGAVIAIVALLGIALIRSGSRRGIRRRQERKELERENALLAERARRTGSEERDDSAAPASGRYVDAPPAYGDTPPAYGEQPRRTP